MEEPLKKSKLPESDSIQELATFWDTHDLTEFEDDLEIVRETVFKRGIDITVQLETADAKLLRQVANSLGRSDVELVREWVLERLHGRGEVVG